MKKYDYLYYYNPQNFRLNRWKLEDWLALGLLIVWAGVILVAMIGVSISVGIFISQVF